MKALDLFNLRKDSILAAATESVTAFGAGDEETQLSFLVSLEEIFDEEHQDADDYNEFRDLVLANAEVQATLN